MHAGLPTHSRICAADQTEDAKAASQAAVPAGLRGGLQVWRAVQTRTASAGRSASRRWSPAWTPPASLRSATTAPTRCCGCHCMASWLSLFTGNRCYALGCLSVHLLLCIHSEYCNEALTLNLWPLTGTSSGRWRHGCFGTGGRSHRILWRGACAAADCDLCLLGLHGLLSCRWAPE